jgi:hypothetical protein
MSVAQAGHSGAGVLPTAHLRWYRPHLPVATIEHSTAHRMVMVSVLLRYSSRQQLTKAITNYQVTITQSGWRPPAHPSPSLITLTGTSDWLQNGPPW